MSQSTALHRLNQLQSSINPKSSASPEDMGSIGASSTWSASDELDYDVLIIGAGLSGIYAVHRMRQLGLRVRVLEAGGGEGGTWYW
jgi:hypothetical protein